MMQEYVGYLIVALFAVGMAAAFFAADRHSPTSRAISLFWLVQGFALFLNVPAQIAVTRDAALALPYGRVYSIIDALALGIGFEWLLRIGRTEVADELEGRRGERLLRVAQAMACVYGLAGLARPDLRRELWHTAPRLDVLDRPGFYLFWIPFTLSFVFAGLRFFQLLKANIDPAERVRLNAVLVAVPFWMSNVSVPTSWIPVTSAIGEVIFLFGAIHYHVMQGQRGQFLARFLSPEVARLVRDRGLAAATARSRVEISAVACDLRGFTAFTDSAAPEEVMKLLEEYHDAVAASVLAHGGFIKDFAGDGILALVGVPIAVPDHARRAVAMALAIREGVEAILGRWQRIGMELGVGVGVASGFVTVGTIGGRERLEYAAVGPAVNLASRLCARAESGRVLADARVAGLAEDGASGPRFEKLEEAELKGFARPVAIFTVTPARPGGEEA